MADSLYDVCVVGAGVWGSAAAYHLSLNPEIKICLVGPKEPSSKEYSKRVIYSSHYDEGRMTRQNTGNIVGAELGKRSTNGFQVLKKTTGISFYTECCSVYFGPIGSPSVASAKRVSEMKEVDHVFLRNDQFMQRYPFLTIGEGSECVLQLSKSCMVNPRKQVLAQKTAALLQGCDVFNSIVDHINEKHQPSGRKILELVTEDGRVIQSRRALLCTGVFTHFKSLLPAPFQLDVKLAPLQALRIELNADDVRRLHDMPTFSSLTRDTNESQFYSCPPVIYPDGKAYLKIGHGHLRYLDSQQDIVNWYRSDGDPRLAEVLLGLVNTYFPGLKPLSTQTDTCVGTETESGLPFIDMVTPEIGIAVGGNGIGVRWSYEVGRIAARMITKGRWDHDLPASEFKVRFKNLSGKL